MKILLLCLLTTLVSAFDTITLTENNHVFFNKKFDDLSVAEVQQKLFDKLSASEDDVYLVIYSPGGSVSAGKLLIDFIQPYKKRINTITIFAASMGYNLVQSANKRYILPSGTLMSHRASVHNLSGEVNGELDNFYSYLKDVVEELEVTASKRIGITISYYKNQVADELWLTGEKAIKSNHADERVYIICDKSLAGTYQSVATTIFGSFSVTYSKCPIITSPVSIDPSDAKAKEEGSLAKFKHSLINIRDNVGYTK